MWIRALRVLAFASLPSLALAAPPIATVTIVDGDAMLVRESARWGLAEGVRLQKDDIVQTGAGARFVRVEFADGLTVDLAGGSQVLLAPRLGGDRNKTVPRLYLLGGTAKLGVPAGAPAVGLVLASPTLDLSDVARGVVVAIAPQETAVFAESGTVSLVERRDFKAQAPQVLRNGQFHTRTGGEKAQVTARPSGAFIQSLPRAFLDTLPSRLEAFKGRDVPPKPAASPLAYGDVQPWIDGEPALRPQFVPRWRALAKTPDFRAGLVAGLAAHPEWDRTLFPEKYRPKAPSPGTTPASARP